MAGVSAEQIAEWQSSSRMHHQIAAVIAAWASGKERGTALPPNAEFGRDLDFVASPSTWKRAKALLARLGVLASNDGPFYVA